MLDEIGGAGEDNLTEIAGFMAHYRLADTGELEAQDFGEKTLDDILKIAYPEILKVRNDAGLENAPKEEEARRMKEAVDKEHARLLDEKEERLN